MFTTWFWIHFIPVRIPDLDLDPQMESNGSKALLTSIIDLPCKPRPILYGFPA